MRSLADKVKADLDAKVDGGESRVRAAAEYLQGELRAAASSGGGTGKLAASIQVITSGTSARVSTDLPYAAILDKGTSRKAGWWTGTIARCQGKVSSILFGK